MHSLPMAILVNLETRSCIGPSDLAETTGRLAVQTARDVPGALKDDGSRACSQSCGRLRCVAGSRSV